ncbi:MAG: T9SS type A sorting domain-containing protein, partial [Bacteroidetes bacterium]|nr:T9SS type A sorting domain-containing protein [Bacteroidota bacterium]
ANGLTLRTYRIAVSATAEYTQFHGGTVADGLAAIVTSVNRVNGVYERDFTIRLVLVDDNDLIVYTSTSGDPFTDPTNPSLLLTQNQSSIDNTIGSSNYDVGHVVGRSGSGLASFRSVCRSNKAQGTTGISNPIGDPFDIDYMAHEIGHQFGGSHTYNGSSGSCGGNISANSAYEPGSGSTIMAYAGICSPQNIQNNSDDYFHVRSYDQIVSYTTNSQGDDCPVKTSTGNSIPQINIISQDNLTIPFSTPFELEASATDADGNTLTYCWEQFDLGPSSAPNTPSGNAPLFRSFSPTTNPIRTFPQIADIVNNTQTMGEILPDYARGMNFRVTVRDNEAGGGAVDYKDIDVNVSGSAGPFLVTEPNTNTSWTAGSTYSVTWDVAGTDQAPINCTAVDIYLSTDGGYTYPILLEAGLLNNGAAFVEAPFAITNDARVKVKCSDNIFFDISNQDFSIDFDCNSVNPSLSIVQDLNNTTWCIGSTGTLSIQASSAELVITSYRWFFNGQLIPGANSSTLSIPNVQNADAGNYSCIVSNDCNSVNSSTASVSVTSNLIVPSISQVGNQLVSSLSTGNQWYYNGEILPGETGQTLNIGAPGAYYVASVAGACSSNSASILTSIQSLEDLANIQVWPNPSSNLINIHVSDYPIRIDFELLDVLGNVLQVKQEIEEQVVLDLRNFSKGVYFLKFYSEEHQSILKIVRD